LKSGIIHSSGVRRMASCSAASCLARVVLPAPGKPMVTNSLPGCNVVSPSPQLRQDLVGESVQAREQFSSLRVPRTRDEYKVVKSYVDEL